MSSKSTQDDLPVDTTDLELTMAAGFVGFLQGIHWSTPGDIRKFSAENIAKIALAIRVQRECYRSGAACSDTRGCSEEELQELSRLAKSLGRSVPETVRIAVMATGTRVGFGIIDPDYARIFTKARIHAWTYGYSCCVQGSLTRDLDLLLVPWTDAASTDISQLVRHFASIAELNILGEPARKPHGRLTWTLMLPGFGENRWVDLSVFPAKQ